MNFAKFVRTHFLQSTTGQLFLFLVVAVSIVVNGEFANENFNYDIKSICTSLSQKCKLSKKGSPGEI